MRDNKGWIPCSERLPEAEGLGHEFLVTLENGAVKILGYNSKPGWLRCPQGFYYEGDDGFLWKQTVNPVVAWRPLPEAYTLADDTDASSSTEEIRPEDASEFLGQIIDIFEDFLEEKGITLENPEKQERIDAGEDPECFAIIYGTDYGNLQDDLSSMLKAWDVL